MKNSIHLFKSAKHTILILKLKRRTTMIIFKYGSTMQRDPWVKFHQGFYYYICAKNDNELHIAKVEDIKKLQEAQFKCVVLFRSGRGRGFKSREYCPR